eukprot:645890-Karenia_brevis.AAC.1
MHSLPEHLSSSTMSSIGAVLALVSADARSHLLTPGTTESKEKGRFLRLSKAAKALKQPAASEWNQALLTNVC